MNTRSCVAAVLALALIAVLAPNAGAADGDPDLTFSTDGIHITSASGGATSVQVNSGGVMIAAGGSSSSTRLQSYDASGTELAADGSSLGSAAAMVLQPDGKIITAGTTSSGGDILVQRFDGSTLAADTTFGTTGSTAINLQGGKYSSAIGRAVALQPDGKIVVVGQVRAGSALDDVLVMRFNSDGTLDTTFNAAGNQDGDPGWVAFEFKSQEEDRGRGVAIQSNGNIVIVGETKSQFAMARLTSAGEFDTAFGPTSSGKVYVENNASNIVDDKTGPAYGVAIEPSTDQIMVTGSKFVNDPNSANCINSGGNFCEKADLWLGRFTTAGLYDLGFGSAGEVTVDVNELGNDDFGTAVTVQADGKVVAVGYTDTGIKTYSGQDENGPRVEKFAVVRVTSTGSLDASFATNGITITDFSGPATNGDQARAVVAQDDGKILVAGDTGNNSNRNFALARYGTTDTSRTAVDDSSNGIVDVADTHAVATNDLNLSFGDDFTLTGNGSASGIRSIDTSSGVVTYTPISSEAGTSVTLDYSVCPDGVAAGSSSCSSATLTVAVTGNTGLTAVADSGSGEAGVAGTYDTASNDQNLTFGADFTLTGSGSAAGAASQDLDSGVVTYTPAAAEASTSVTIEYSVCPNGVVAGNSSCSTAMLTISVTGTVLQAMCLNQIVTVNLNASPPQVPTEGDDVILGTPNADTIDALGGNDVICGEGGDDIISGGAGNDTVRAGNGNDTVHGGPGDDRLFGVAGDDIMNGDAGVDTLHGNRGNDTLDGGADDDRVFGYAGNDILNGGTGVDKIFGHFGNDTINGGEGDDRLFGWGDQDTINGGPGNDLISGNFGDDLINGDDGNDTLFGSDGDDRVNGGDGNDLVNGNSLNDTLTGGLGNDTLDGGIGQDSCNGNAGTDTATRCELLIEIP